MGQFLRQLRIMCGYPVKEVIEQLKLQDITIAAKTLYGYERGSSLPNVTVFIALCHIYTLENIKLLCNLPSIDSKEVDLINKYRLLDRQGKEFVDTLMNYELLRLEEIKYFKETYEKQLKK